MHQAPLNLTVIPSGEAEKWREVETDDGTYFALSYRRKRVCIDSGLQCLLDSMRLDVYLADRIDSIINHFLSDYKIVWWKNPRTGEFLEVAKVTTSLVKMMPEGMRYAPRQMAVNTLILTPHYKVPNDQGLGRAPLHVS